MSVPNPSRCLFLRRSMPDSKSILRYRNFHTSVSHLERRRSRYANVKAEDMGLIAKQSESPLKPYSKKERQALAKRYTPAQLTAIRAGEKAIDPEDIRTQGTFRKDQGRLSYLDDLSVVRPVVDKRFKDDEKPLAHDARWLNEEESLKEFREWMGHVQTQAEKALSSLSVVKKAEADCKGTEDIPNLPPSSSFKLTPQDERILDKHNAYAREEFMKYMLSAPGVSGGSSGPSSLAPVIPKVPEQEERYQVKQAAEDVRDPEGKFQNLMTQTGLTLDQILKFQSKVLVQHGVTNQTRLGKVLSTYILAISGDGNGRLGIGECKGVEMDDTRFKAIENAIRYMRPIPRYENRTIYGEVEGKVAAAKVKLMARPPGFGLRVQHNIFEMARAAGIQDLAARVPRSRNAMNTIKATYQALMSQKLPDEIARGRGKKLVDVRRVYYGGSQPIPSPPRRKEK